MNSLSSPLERLALLEEQFLAARLELDSLRRVRQPIQATQEQPKLAITCSPASGSYPVVNANVFPIKFLDCDYTATTGQRTLTQTARQAAQATVALFPSGNWIPNGTVVSVYQARGLGAADAGDWFILDGPKAFFARLTADLTAPATGSAEVFTDNDSTDTLLATLTVKSGPLVLDGVTLDEDTWVHVSWDEIEDAWLIDGASCGPEV